jgi:DNA-binding CsgD family transcriptional regulator
MAIIYRRMEPRDVRACAAIIARHPVLGPRYGGANRHLAATLLKLLRSDALVAAVFEERQGTTTVVLGAAVATFVTDEFVRELKASPRFWIGPEIVFRTHRGKSPVLSDKQIRDANTSGGLNAAVWHTGVLPENLPRPEVGNTIMTSCVELHSGFLLKEIIFQVENAAHIEGVRAIGAFLWKFDERSYERLGPAPETILQEPHVMGVTRELASGLSGVWAASLFLYNSPRFGFSRGEQRLLTCGLEGGTDQEIADKLGISLVAVRKRWRTIYERVAMVEPKLAPNPIQEDRGSGERGKAKKQRLLAYIREHPEELRPVSRILVSKLDPKG